MYVGNAVGHFNTFFAFYVLQLKTFCLAKFHQIFNKCYLSIKLQQIIEYAKNRRKKIKQVCHMVCVYLNLSSSKISSTKYFYQTLIILLLKRISPTPFSAYTF